MRPGKSFSDIELILRLPGLLRVLLKRRLPIASTSQTLFDYLATSKTHLVQEQSWLVMFYSVALSQHSMALSEQDAVPEEAHMEVAKAKLKSNLWLAFNDVRLFIEPSLLNIQALVVLATRVEEFMTPSVCWMLISKACATMGAIGQTRRNHESSDQQKSHAVLFWQLNLLDKSLALSLMKPPTIHKEAMKAIPMPSLDQLVLAQQRPNESRVFDAHYMHQLYLLSEIMGEASHLLSTQARRGFDHEAVSSNMDRLDEWYSRATEVSTASASVALSHSLTKPGASSSSSH